MMNILLLGSGGREHAIAWKMAQSSRLGKLYIAPGNAGTGAFGENVNISVTDFDSIGKFSLKHDINMVVVGPEEPLVKGIFDYFMNNPALRKIPVIGPSAEGAQLEGSKAYSKKFMGRHNIPTAAYREFTAESVEEGVKYLEQHALPIVLKADGLAAGKGVLILNSREEAISEFREMILQSKFGDASKKVVVEQFLDGIELSVFALTDGKNYVILPEAKDYKRIGEGDTGNNTGGMGAVSPVPFADKAFMQKVEDTIVRPTVEGLHSENINYKGFIFFGLIKVNGEPMVIEYNCRMGDPETEVVMPRLKNDLVELFEATANGTLDQINIEHDSRTACTVMAVSGGYPGDYAKGFAISGLDQQSAESMIFHAGTGSKDNSVVTSGGRVLCVTSYGSSVGECIDRSRKVLEGISFDGMYYRKDIGYEFIS
jgi:phosphoribosylamine--glycine ligase